MCIRDRKCGNQGLKANGKVKRKILGEKVVKAIRFPAMKQKEFASVVPDTKILTPDEVINIFKFFSSAVAAPDGFLSRKRSGSLSGGGQGGQNLPPPVPYSPASRTFISGLPPVTVLFPSPLNWQSQNTS